MGVDDEHLGRDVLFPARHARNTSAASALDFVGVDGKTLDVAELRQREDAFLLRNQILNIDLAADGADFRAARVGVFIADRDKLLLDDFELSCFAGENFEEVRDFRLEPLDLLLYLVALHVGKLSETHLHDCLCLHLVESEALHQRGTRGRLILARADDADDLVDEVDRDFQALENVHSVLGFFQVEFRSAADDVLLELDIALQHILKRQDLRLTVDDREHDRAEGHLQLRIGKQLVEHDLRRAVALDVDFNVHADTVGVILDVGNALDALFLDEVGDVLNQTRLVDLVGQLGDDDLESAVLRFDDLCLGADGDFALAGGIGGADAASAHNDAARRKIRTGEVLHQLGKLDIGVVDAGADRVDGLAEVMRRNLGRHTDGDTAGAVDEKIREAAREHDRLLETVVVVGDEIDGFLVDVGEHIHRDLAHSGFCVTVSSRRVAVYGAEVSVTVDEHIAHGEVLGKTHHRIIYGRVAVGVIGTQHGTDGVGALVVGLRRVKTSLVHGVENPSVDRLETVAHIGKRSRHDNAHGVIQKALLHLVLQVNVNDSVFIHLLFVTHCSTSNFLSLCSYSCCLLYSISQSS